jgi:4-hydroxybenzoate polyprenyltransferase
MNCIFALMNGGKPLKKTNEINLFLRLVRFPNLLIVVTAQYLAAIFLIGPPSEWLYYLADLKLFLISISTVLIASAGYIINDYYDVKIDTINKPERIVVGKFMSRRTAMKFHSVLNILGIGFGFCVNWKVGGITLIISFLLWLYSVSFKKLPFIGNFLVALLTAGSLLLLIFYYNKNDLLIIIYALFAFFISLVREIIKDIEDMKGDIVFGCKTLPIIFGLRKTKSFLFLIILFFVISLIGLGNRIKPSILVYFIPFVFIPLIWLSLKLLRADSVKDFRHLSLLCKMIMLSGILSMIFIGY